jgi:hypothetical protein
MWWNLQDFKMPNGLAPCFIAKYVGLYEIIHKSHLDMYTLKFLVNFVAHPTFHISKLKLFLQDEEKLDWKQQVWSEVNVIKHKVMAEIKSILYMTRLKGKEYLMKYKGCHHKEVVDETCLPWPLVRNGE